MMKTMVVLTALAAGALLITLGCAKEEPSTAKPKYRLAMAEIHQETHSFSPVITTEENFKTESPLLYGNEMIPYGKKEKMQLGGFIAAVEKHGRGEFEIIPILKARSVSGGPVDRGLYERLKRDLIAGLKKAGRLDGIYLSLHGAMGVVGMRDPEGDILEAIRREVSATVPVGISHDLHANVTKKRARLATFIVGYHTNPHRDFSRVGNKSGEILVKTARGEVKPVMAVRKMKLLKGGGMNVDFLSPMRQIFRRMKKMEKEPGVLSVSNFMVHIYLDDPELGWSTVAVTDGDRAKAEKLAEEIADLDWSVRDVPHPKASTPEEAVAIAKNARLARLFGTVVFCDVSDTVGTGAPGENTWLLKALLEGAPELVSYVPVRDAGAAAQAFKANLNDTVALTVGGKLEKVYNRPLAFVGELIYKKEGRLGKTVILRHKGVHLILTEMPDSTRKPDYFTDLGLSVWKADVVVVKNLFPFRFFFILQNRKTVNVASPGISNVDPFALKYTKIPRPIYPLDKIADWR